ncbi:MAG: helix-turn-helix transcriptional regulator [Saccharothrix sp.]|nr:helix-turn-helix transcriptional regulator [Saccharothrix sp.]
MSDSPSRTAAAQPQAPHPALHALGTEVRRKRLSSGWSLDDLAERSGLSRRMVIDVEHGRRNPSTLVLLTLAAALDTDAAVLLRPAQDAFATAHQMPIAGPHRTGSPPPEGRAG